MLTGALCWSHPKRTEATVQHASPAWLEARIVSTEALLERALDAIRRSELLLARVQREVVSGARPPAVSTPGDRGTSPPLGEAIGSI
jgi:hypothetical protein